MEHRSRSAAITSARPARRRCRSSRSRCATASNTCSAGVDAGLDVDDFAPRLSFFFNSHNDFFEEIAKFRAARKLWAEVMRDRFGAKDERSWKLRFHTQTAGVSLTAQQPYNNVVRTALQALAAVLGGTQSLHTNSLDEALALPTAEAATLALRTQQIIAHESGVTNTVDPLGGSYFVERLTLDMERGRSRVLREIDRMGGMVEAIEQRLPAAGDRREPRTGSSRRSNDARRSSSASTISCRKTQPPIPILYIDDTTARRQLARLEELRRTRDNDQVRGALDTLRETARRDRQYHVSAARRRPRVCDGRRDVRRVAGCLGRVPGDAADITAQGLWLRAQAGLGTVR